jgi:hypothetical protein
VECCKNAAMTIASEELTAIRVATAEEALDSKQPACSFEPTENIRRSPSIPRLQR